MGHMTSLAAEGDSEGVEGETWAIIGRTRHAAQSRQRDGEKIISSDERIWSGYLDKTNSLALYKSKLKDQISCGNDRKDTVEPPS